MKKEIFDTLPYISRKELVDLRDYMNSNLEEYGHLIYDDMVESVLYQYRDITEQYVFNIQFQNFDQGSKLNLYSIYYCPLSLTKIKGESSIKTFTQIKEVFKNWIQIVSKMHEITNEYYDPFKNFYDEQFQEFFTNNDDDSNVNPFEVEKQEVIYYFLIYAEQVIVNSNEVQEENKKLLLNEISELKDNIPTFTKKRFVKALSKFAKNTKKASNKLFHDVFDVLKKEVIKKLLYEGVDQLPHIAHKIQTWYSLFIN